MNTVENAWLARAALWWVAVALGLAADDGFASDAEGEFHGYVRFGVGQNTSSHGEQACFGLQGIAKYRLGNECDFIGEVAYTKELAKTANGVSIVGTAMAAAANPNPQYRIEDSSLRMSQAFVEVKHIDALKGGTIWAGERYYNRPDIHVLDLKYVHMDGVGGGIDGIPLGPGKFSYALFRNDVDKTQPANRHAFTYQDLPVNTNGTLKFDATVIRADSSVPNAHDGWSLSIAHKQDKFLGGDNIFALQYGVGPGIKIGGTGDLTLDSEVTRTRVFDQLIWQIGPKWIGSANFLVQRDKSKTGTQTWTSVGARPVYALRENLKLQWEVGHDRITPADGGATQRLTKITFAPTLVLAPRLATENDFWRRPELRAFVTYAKWNDAAQTAAPAGSALSSSGVFGGKTNGISFGVQFETWF